MNERSLAYSERVATAPQQMTTTFGADAWENPGVVDSLLHPQAILIRKILTRAGRMELNLILIDDEENITQALDADVEIHSLYYTGTLPSAQLIRKLPHAVKIHEIARRTCKKIFENDRISRLFAIARTPVALPLDSLLEITRDIVALEDLTISGNIGAIVRTSLAFSAGGIVLLNAEQSDIYDRRLIRASRGHVFSLPVLTATTQEFLHFCKQKSIPIAAMAAQADRAVHEAAVRTGRLAIVLGGEKGGCSEALMNAAALRLRIPTNSMVESLNVSTAAGIMLYNRLWFNHPQAGK
jgi:TrmH family RNA methyltransferase